MRDYVNFKSGMDKVDWAQAGVTVLVKGHWKNLWRIWNLQMKVELIVKGYKTMESPIDSESDVKYDI